MSKKPDYKGFVKHKEFWDNHNVAYGLNDLRELARMYNCPIPKKYRQKKGVKND